MKHPEIITMKIKDLKPAKYNPRKITKKEIEKLKQSIAEYGMIQNIVINKENPRLLDWTIITGRSGAKYRGYRIREGATREDIEDPKLLQLYDILYTAYA